MKIIFGNHKSSEKWLIFPVGAAAKNESGSVEKKKHIALKVKKPDAASAAANKVKEAEVASPKNSKVAAK